MSMSRFDMPSLVLEYIQITLCSWYTYFNWIRPIGLLLPHPTGSLLLVFYSVI